MPLVNYSSDSSNGRKTKKRKTAHKLPPLPDSFQDLYAAPVRTSKEDDPSLHSGRQRVTPHIDGNWPTHVYAEWSPTISQRNCIQKLIELHSPVDCEVHDLLFSDLGVPSPLHISLSRSLGLKAEQRLDFAEELKLSIEQTNVHSFEVGISGVEWVSNFTQTRSFLVIHVQTGGHDNLRALLDASNRTAVRFGQEELYTKEPLVCINETQGDACRSDELSGTDLVFEDDNSAPQLKTFDSLHVSIAWTLSRPESSKLSDRDDSKLAEELLLKLKVPVNAVKAKIGNNILTFPLKRAVSS